MKRILCGALSALLIFTGIQLPVRAETAGTEETAAVQPEETAATEPMESVPVETQAPETIGPDANERAPQAMTVSDSGIAMLEELGGPRHLQLPHGPDAGGEQREQLPLCKRPDPDAAAVRRAGLPAVQLLCRALGLPRDPTADGRGLYRGQHGQCVVLVGQRGRQLFFQNARAAYPRAAGLFLWRLYRKRE